MQTFLQSLTFFHQVSLTIDLDHVQDHDPELAEAIRGNTRRFSLLVSDVVWEMLPEYRERDPPAKDALDVYIHHRQMMENRIRGPNEHR